MIKNVIRTVAVASLLMSGCDHADRLAKLEKENQDLKAQMDKVSAATSFDLQAKCAHDAKSWFSDNWSRDRDTILLTYENHYNQQQKHCFAVVEFHYKLDGGDGWIGDETLYDVYENSKHGSVSVAHITYIKPQFHIDETVNECYVANLKCRGTEEFNNAARPYMSN